MRMRPLFYLLGACLCFMVASYDLSARQLIQKTEPADKTSKAQPVQKKQTKATTETPVSEPVSPMAVGIAPVINGVGRDTRFAVGVAPVINGVGRDTRFAVGIAPVINGVGRDTRFAVGVAPVINGVGRDTGFAVGVAPTINGVGRAEPEPVPVVELNISDVVGDIEIVSVKLLQLRTTERGGSLPFDAEDIAEEISPEGIIAQSPNVTCGAGLTFPIAPGFASPISFAIPSEDGNCELDSTVSNTADIAFQLSSFSASTASVTPQNGWSVDQAFIVFGIGSPLPNSLIVSKGARSYTVGLDAEGGAGLTPPIRATITSFVEN